MSRMTVQELMAQRERAKQRREAFNPQRRLLAEQGIRGKGKKRFRKAQREQARAKIALVDERTSGGLVNDRS